MTDEQLKLADELVRAIHITISTRDGTSVIRTNLMPNHRTMIDDALRAATRPAPTEAVREALQLCDDVLATVQKAYKCPDSPIINIAREKARAALSVGEAVSATKPITEDQIKHMVDRFLGWKLPSNFCPDAGISFKADFNENTAYPMKHEPSGTNLFDATQTDGMVRHMIERMTAAAVPSEAIGREWQDISTRPDNHDKCWIGNCQEKLVELAYPDQRMPRWVWRNNETDKMLSWKPDVWMPFVAPPPLPAGPSVTRPHHSPHDQQEK